MYWNTGTDAGGSLSSLLESPDGLSLLPVLRWADVSGGMTSRVDGWDNFNPLTWFGSIPANLSGAFLSLGNSLWATAAWFQQAASGVDIIGKVGPIANKFMGAMYTGLTGDWIVFTIPAIIAIMTGLWSAVRGHGAKELCRRAGALFVGLGLFVTMGATSVTSPDTPAAGTPYWMVQTASSIIGNAGGGIADTLLNGTALNSNAFLASKSDAVDRLSCRRYTAQLDEEYSSGSNLAASANPVLTSLNRMWEETGLRIWSRQQYGPGENASQVFCRVLEARAGTDPRVQYSLTDKASGYVLSGSAEASDSSDGYLAAVWSANLMTDKDLDDGKDQPEETWDKKLDRVATVFDVCGHNGSEWIVRPGWDWVDAIKEDHRGLFVNDEEGNDRILDECQAIITGHYNGGDYTVGTSDQDTTNGRTRMKITVDEKKFNDKINDIIRKFDIETTLDWQALTVTNPGDSTIDEINQAVTTMNQQHGTASMGDVGAAVVFAVSGLINLIIWGVILGLMRIASLFVACFLACAGIGLGALILAFAPDKGRKAVLNATGRMFGMCAGVTVVGLVAAVGCVFVNTGMGLLGLLDNDGNTAGTVLSMSLASMILPLGYLWMIRYLCVNVWRIGDPFSARALGSIMGGGAILGGLKTLGVAALAGGAGALAGGGLAGALSAAGRSLSMGGRGGMIQGMLQGADTGRREAFYNHMGAGRHAAGRPMESGADAAARRAAGDGSQAKPEDQPQQGTPSAARQEYLRQATRRRRAELVEEYRNAGLSGDALDAAVDKALHSGNVGEQVAHMADDLAAASPRDAYQAKLDGNPGMLADMRSGLIGWGESKVRNWTANHPETAAMIGAGATMSAAWMADKGRLMAAGGRRIAAGMADKGHRIAASRVGRAASATGRFVRDTALPAATNLASDATRLLAEHPKLATAAMVGTGLALPMSTPLMMAGLGGTLAAHTTLNANGMANRGYHAVQRLPERAVESFNSSRTSAMLHTTATRTAPTLAAVSNRLNDMYAASGLASDQYLAQRAENVRNRVYNDQAVNGMATSGMAGGLDELLHQGLPGEQSPAERYANTHPDSPFAKDMRMGAEMYRQFVEQGGDESDGAMRDAPYILGHGTNAAQGTGVSPFSWTPDKTRNGGSSMPDAGDGDAHRSRT